MKEVWVILTYGEFFVMVLLKALPEVIVKVR